jgi:hypothetical protein
LFRCITPRNGIKSAKAGNIAIIVPFPIRKGLFLPGVFFSGLCRGWKMLARGKMTAYIDIRCASFPLV